MALLKLVLGLHFTLTAVAQNVIDLSGSDWTLANPPYNNISVPGAVPSQAHLDLYAAGIISDP